MLRVNPARRGPLEEVSLSPLTLCYMLIKLLVSFLVYHFSCVVPSHCSAVLRGVYSCLMSSFLGSARSFGKVTYGSEALGNGPCSIGNQLNVLELLRCLV